MFGKNIRCPYCKKEVKKKFDFCPYCAAELKDLKKEYGLLGRDDEISSIQNMLAPKVNRNVSFMDKLVSGAVNRAMSMIEQEMRQSQEPVKKIKNEGIETHMELFINGKRVNLPKNIEGIQIKRIGKNQDAEIKQKTTTPKISSETIEKSQNLPRKEAKTKLARTSDKVIYELDTPVITDLNNILINRLENSIEIKAYTSKAVYYKTLPGKLLLLKYGINPQDEKVILEFKS